MVTINCYPDCCLLYSRFCFLLLTYLWVSPCASIIYSIILFYSDGSQIILFILAFCGTGLSLKALGF